MVIVLPLLAAKGQNYIPLIDTTATWDIGHEGMECFCYCDNPRRYFFKGDTIINSVKYHTVYAFDSESEFPFCPTFTLDTISYLTDIFIREDTSTQRVYRYYPDSEELLFDFSLNQGDTINDMVIDTVYYYTTTDGVTRKVLNFWYWGDIDPPEMAMVEGIGGPWGPFEKPYWWFENYLEPLCFKKNGVQIFYGLCYNMTTVNTYNPDKEIIKCYPNPVVDYLTIEVPENFGVFEIKLLDCSGKIIQTSQGSHTLKMKMTAFPSGIYTARLISTNVDYSFKVVKL